MINTIIFDLGGVLLNIYYQKTSDAFRELGVSNFDNIYSQAKQSTLFSDIETGKISPEEFRSNFKKNAKIDLSEQEFDNAWNAMLGNFPIEKFNYLKRLKDNGIRLFLLSNTNIIHLQAFKRIIDKEIGYDMFYHLFEKVYYSHEIGLRKPNKNIFDYVINENKLTPKHTLFIDDTMGHFDGATAANLNIYYQESNTPLELNLSLDF